MCAQTSSELKISIEAARLACPKKKDDMHFLPSSVPIAEFDPVDQCIGSGMSIRTEMLCEGKRSILAKSLRTTTSYLRQEELFN